MVKNECLFEECLCCLCWNILAWWSSFCTVILSKLTCSKGTRWRVCDWRESLCFAAADSFLWKDKYLSGGVLGLSTLTWFLLEKSGYTFLTLMSNILMFIVVILFVWANVAALLNRYILISSSKSCTEFRGENRLFFRVTFWVRWRVYWIGLVLLSPSSPSLRTS